MSTMNLSSTSHISPSFRLRSLPPCFYQNTPTLGLNSQFKSSSISLNQLNSRLKHPYKLRIKTIVSAANKLSETSSIPLPDEGIAGKLPSGAGIYAVFDQSNVLQFIGISRNVAASVTGYRKSLPDLCCSVKVAIVEEPDRNALTQAWKSWMEEHIGATGKVPPGNEKGNTTWVRPPPKAKSDLRLTPGRHVQLTVPLEQLIDRLVKENKVVAFIKGSRSAPLCGFSQKVIGILESQGVDYESVDVLDEEYNNGLREMLKKYSNWPTFPQIFVDGELVGGCDILASMYEQGEISNMLKK